MNTSVVVVATPCGSNSNILPDCVVNMTTSPRVIQSTSKKRRKTPKTTDNRNKCQQLRKMKPLARTNARLSKQHNSFLWLRTSIPKTLGQKQVLPPHEQCAIGFEVHFETVRSQSDKSV